MEPIVKILRLSAREQNLLRRAVSRLIYIGETEGWKPTKSSWTDDFDIKDRDTLQEIHKKL